MTFLRIDRRELGARRFGRSNMLRRNARDQRRRASVVSGDSFVRNEASIAAFGGEIQQRAMLMVEDEKEKEKEKEEERIRDFAYRIWEEEGYPVGEADRHWEMAREAVEAEKAERVKSAVGLAGPQDKAPPAQKPPAG
jgi:hypothetical protein